ncbi:TIGR04283 family arsenosugar biosynthesis glycosyltransferase [Planktotalea arctica]|uniref:TIGR04283 family arsenosugar biosynthesis glycosyltransferase n=1 Tax=Planktotalea arctica TaxID=1481893 RepID=UPI003219234D
MRAPISVVIPVLNAGDVLAGCASALMEAVEVGLIRELIVSDGGSNDATRQIAEEIGALWVSGAPSRGGQLRRGCAVAKGEWILALHADTQLQAGWSDVAAAHLQRSEAGYFKLAFASGGMPARIVAGWANLRSRVLGLPYGDQGLLISRAVYQEVGGYEDMPLMEDVAMARALSGRLRALDARAVTSAQKYQKAGWLWRGGRNLWTLLRYFAGVPVERLAAQYRRP